MALYLALADVLSVLSCLQSDFFYEILGLWLLIAGAVGFVAMGIDKTRAIGGQWRIPESKLLIISLVGGSLGTAAGAMVFHHKTSKIGFLVLFLPIVIAWLLALQRVGFLNCLGTFLPQ